MKAIIKLIRPGQWIKNGLVFVPLFFARSIFDADKFVLALYTFIGFCAAASFVYVINDLADIEHDKLHPRKRFRPLASGAVSKSTAYGVALILIAVLTFITHFFIPGLGWVFVAYIVLNSLYSFWLKHVSVIDLVLVSFFYFLRIEAGGYATTTPISNWLILCTIFVSLFIIVAKRKAEMNHEHQRKVLAHYTEVYLNHLLTLSGAVTLVSYGVYTVLGNVPQAAVYSNFFVIVGLLRYLQLSYTTGETERPEKIIGDRIIIGSFLMWFVYMLIIFY